MSKPLPNNYAAFFQRYIDQVPENDLTAAFKNQTAGIASFLNSITEEQSMHAYAAGKWTIKEMLQHIIDTERIFVYRALCFARGEKNSLPGFEENDYAANSHANNRTWKSLTEEFIATRQSTERMFESFTEDALNAAGISNNNPMSTASAGFIIVGHYYHHKKVLLERYL